MNFHSITFDDKAKAKELLALSDYRAVEYSFVNNYVWQRYYKLSACFYKDFYLVRNDSDGTSYFMPAGKGDYSEVFAALAEINAGEPLVIQSVTDEQLHIFEELYPDSFTVSSDDGDYDYIYSAEKLRTLAGKKLHGKRNHLSNFKKKYNWSYSSLTEADFDDCIVLAAEKFNDKQGYESGSAVSEQLVINTMFENFSELELFGGALRVDGRLAAFTIGSMVNSDTVDVHIEKASDEFAGAYPAINNMFVSDVSEKRHISYVNREEDMGIEGLRKSKMSYYPEYLLKKNTVKIDLCN